MKEVNSESASLFTLLYMLPQESKPKGAYAPSRVTPKGAYAPSRVTPKGAICLTPSIGSHLSYLYFRFDKYYITLA